MLFRGANDRGESEPRDHLKVVSHEEWVKQLEAEGRKQHHDVKNNPALKLLEFSQILENGTSARKETKETQRGSNTMRNLKSVDVEWGACGSISGDWCCSGGFPGGSHTRIWNSVRQ